MTIEEIKAIPIAAFLARMGYEPARRRGDEYWYLAPYREERTASFQVNVRKEIWHDFGTGQGGDIFNLAGEFIGNGDFKAQARFITETWGGLAPSTRPFPALMGVTGRISSRRRVSLMYASGLYTTESCSDIWRNAALAAMWLYRTVGKSDIPCTGNGISPSDSGMSATDTSCATVFSRPACHLRTFH